MQHKFDATRFIMKRNFMPIIFMFKIIFSTEIICRQCHVLELIFVIRYQRDYCL